MAGLGAAALDGPLAFPRGETVLVASSFEQARISFEHILAFMGDKLDNRDRWRVWDMAQQARRTCSLYRKRSKTGARAHAGSDLGRRAGSVPDNTGDRMVAALSTAAGKQPHCLFLALGTEPASEHHWFSKWLRGSADYAQLHAARDSDPKFQRRTWRKANPSLDHMPDSPGGSPRH